MMHKFYLGLFLLLLAACNSGGGGSSSGGGGETKTPETPTQPTTPPKEEEPTVPGTPVHTTETKSYSIQADQTVAVSLTNEGYTTATLTTPPTKGLLSGSYPNYSYLSIGSSGGGSDQAVINLSKNGFTKTITLNFFINTAPVANNLTLSTSRGQGMRFDLPGSDADGDTLSYTITQNPNAGTIVEWIPGSKSIAFEAPNSAATITFFYKVSDGKSESSAGKVTILVTSTIPTITSGATLTALEDMTGVYTASATDAGGGALTYSVATQGTKGAVSVSGAAFTYTPIANYSGADTFKIRATNSAGGFAEKVISVTVTPTNDSPVFSDFSFSTLKNIDTFYIMSTAVVDPDSTTLAYSRVSNPSKGTISFLADRVFYYPNLNAKGNDTFTVRVCDNGAPIMCDDAIVSVTIINQVQEPTAIDMTLDAVAGTALPITLNAIYDDLANITVEIKTQPTKGILVSNGGLSYTYTPSFNEDGESSGVDYFSFMITEGGFVSDQAVVTLNISYPFNYIELNLEGGFKRMGGLREVLHKDEVVESMYYLSTDTLEVAPEQVIDEAFISLDKDSLICPAVNTNYLMIPLHFEVDSSSEIFTLPSGYECSDLKTTNSDESDVIYATSDLILRQAYDSVNFRTKTYFGVKTSSEDNNTTLAELNMLNLNNFERLDLDLASKESTIVSVSSFSNLLRSTTIMGEGSGTHLFLRSSDIVKSYLDPSTQLEIYHKVLVANNQMTLHDTYYRVGTQMRRFELLLNEWYLSQTGEAPEDSLAPNLNAGSVVILGDVVVVRKEQGIFSDLFIDEETGEEDFEYKTLNYPKLEIYNRKP